MRKSTATKNLGVRMNRLTSLVDPSKEEIATHEIPSSWSVCKLEEVLRPEKGSIKIGPFGSQLKKTELAKEGYKVYGQENVIYNDYKAGDRFVSTAKFATLKGFELLPGDFLITMMGTIGRTGIFPKDALKGIMDSHLIRLRLNEDLINPHFLEHLLSSPLIKRQIAGVRRGVVMDGLNTGIVKTLEIPLPPLAEQRRIAARIEGIERSIDGIKSDLFEVRNALCKYRTSMLLNVFKNQLTVRRTLGELIVPSNNKYEPSKRECLAYIGLEHIEKGTGRLLGYGNSSNVTSTKTKFKRGDVLYGKLRPYLNKVAIPDRDGVCSTDILVFPQNSNILAKFLYYRLQSVDFVQFACDHVSGVQHPRTNFKMISKFEMCQPTIAEQEKAINIFENGFNFVKQLETEICNSIEKLDCLKASITDLAFKGRLVPQDPNDESVKNLLERLSLNKKGSAQSKREQSNR